MSGPRACIGVIGHGAFGRLMARHLAPHFDLKIFDRDGAAPEHGTAVPLAEAASCPIVILAVPVEAMAAVVARIAPHLAPGAVVMDVGSVKVKPVQAMLAGLPEHVRIVGLHPLFGPQSAKDGVAGLRIAVCPVRGDREARRTAAFCRAVLGLRTFVVSAEDHDREAAVVQGLTHLIAKVLTGMEPLPARLTTASFDRLVQATDMVRHDAPEVFTAIQRDNPYAAEVRERFFAMADRLRKSLEDV